MAILHAECYGHKINLSSGNNGMILDVVIESGNPTDTPMVKRLQEIYGQLPQQVAVDAGYASKENIV